MRCQVKMVMFCTGKLKIRCRRVRKTMTFLELFARAYMTPQEISVEASIPIEVVYRLRAGGQASEREARRVLRVVNSRLEKPVSLSDLPAHQIQ